jgi:hypothetical protein
MMKCTGLYRFDLDLKNNGNNTYSAELGGPDLFTWGGIALHLIFTLFLIIYKVTTLATKIFSLHTFRFSSRCDSKIFFFSDKN